MPYLRAENDEGAFALAALPFECEPDSEAEREFLALVAQLEELDAPGLPSLSSHGVEGGVPYLAFSAPHGRVLSEHLSDGRVPSAMVLSVADHLLATLILVHEAGLVHGDIGPDCVLVDVRSETSVSTTLLSTGVAPLIARLRAANARASGPVPSGSTYRAPELLAGLSPSISTDLYAVGALIHHMVAGEPPRLSIPKAPYADMPTLYDVVARALSEVPAARYDSAEAMRGALNWIEIVSDKQDVTRQDIPVWMEYSRVGSHPVPELIRANSAPPPPIVSLAPLAPSLTTPKAKLSSLRAAPLRGVTLPPPPAPRPRSVPPVASAIPSRTSSVPPVASTIPSRTSSVPPVTNALRLRADEIAPRAAPMLAPSRLERPPVSQWLAPKTAPEFEEVDIKLDDAFADMIPTKPRRLPQQTLNSEAKIAIVTLASLVFVLVVVAYLLTSF